MPKVSVIIPAYNAMEFLPRTLDSVLGQTFRDFEVIVVNDGSKDGIESWAKTIIDTRVRFISQSNQGQSAARNTGINDSVGKYIAFLDSDDLWDPRKLEKQVKVMDKNPDIGLVYTWVAELSTDDIILKKNWRFSNEGDVWERLVQGNIIACGSVPMIRRSCIEKVGLFSKFPFACEDWDFWIRISEKYPFKVIREVLTYYRSNPSSLSRSTPEGMKNRLNDMEISFTQILESVFSNASSYDSRLKSKSFAAAFMHISWIALNEFENGHEEVHFFQQKAAMHMPEIVDTLEYKRLIMSTRLSKLLGFSLYQKYRALIHLKSFLNIPKKAPIVISL
ncbi:glycosyl transferase family A [filamentous cyanobacterium CCP5]|nr:glycosyl transferase family A [filamentous cyanobacterium CCP5]